MAKSPFDHVNAIYTDQNPEYFDNLDEADQKGFQPYMVNRIISMNMEFIPVVRELSKYFGIVGSRETYLFYSQILPKGKRYDKYIKADKEKKYEEWVVDVVARYFSVSRHEAIEYLGLMFRTDEGKADLRGICEFYGTDPKKIKKLKI